MDNLTSVLENVLGSLAKMVSEVAQDKMTRLLAEVYQQYYVAKEFKEPIKSSIALVDAGIYPLDMDIARVLYIQIGALVRDSEGKLGTINIVPGLEKYPPVERIILTVTRRRTFSEGTLKHVFEVRIQTPERSSLLLESNSEAQRISKEITEVLRELGLTVELRRPSLYRKLARYIEGLIELAYGIKLAKYGNLSTSLIDGTLIRWLRPKRRSSKYKIDGLDILSAILSSSTSKVKKQCVDKLAGLAKTTTFTTLARAMKIFEPKLKQGRYELYTLINKHSLPSIKMLLETVEEKGFEGCRIPREVIEDIVKKLSTKVYPAHELWVSRFPLTMDGEHIMVLDVYTEKPPIGFIQEGKARFLKTFPLITEETNKRVDTIVKEAFSAKSPLPGRPPTGFMEIDENVRVYGDLRKLFEAHLTAAALNISKRDKELSKILLQIIKGSLRLRLGYGV